MFGDIGLLLRHRRQATIVARRAPASFALPPGSLGASQTLAKRKVRPHLIIVAGVFRKNAPKVIFVEHDHVVGTLAPR